MSPILSLAHGAGAGMGHPFLVRLAGEIEARGVGVRRYEFPYMRAGRKRVDPPAVCHAAVRDALEEARRAAPGAPLFAGGKSFGGRMSSQAAAEGALPEARGIVFFGFPLHPAGKPSIARAEHLARVPHPMLFLQGTRDELAQLDLLRPVVASLGPRATLHVVPDADHSFHVLRSTGRRDDDVLAELAEVAARWMLDRAG